MDSFQDFCKWAGTQRRASLLLGVSEATVSRMVRGEVRVSPEVAEKCEQASHGLFRKERVLWPDKAA
jgi:DNA-binding transcriptional regulator YdaS (Cro superfamily)